MPLSNPQVISLLNRYFVPVYTANEDYRGSGSAPPEERAELRRIHQEGYQLQLSVGTVHGYVLSPEGKTMDSVHVARAAKELLPMLQRAIEKLGTRAGEPLVPPAPQSAPPAAPGSPVLHVTARYLERREGRLELIRTSSGDWSAMPGEDWLALSEAQQQKLLPPGNGAAGAAWELDPEVGALILNRFYPPTENNDLAKNRIEEQVLRATVTGVRDGIATARITGRYRMKHPFYHKDDGNFAEGTLAGYLRFEPKTGRLRALRLTTDEATYGEPGRGRPFGAVVRSVP